MATSAEPKNAPSISVTTNSGTIVRHGIPGRGPESATRGLGGGAVSRWAARARVPTSPVTSAVVRPASGCSAVASTVTRIGPTMNTASSTTASSAYAVCTSLFVART